MKITRDLSVELGLWGWNIRGWAETLIQCEGEFSAKSEEECCHEEKASVSVEQIVGILNQTEVGVLWQIDS